MVENGDVRAIKRKLERDLEMELGDDYILDLKKNYDIDDEEKYDIIPEIWNGRNIADYIDPEIEAKLLTLEKEEEERLLSGYYDLDLDPMTDDMLLTRELVEKIRLRKGLMKCDQRMNQTNKPKLPRTAKKVKFILKIKMIPKDSMMIPFLTKAFQLDQP